MTANGYGVSCWGAENVLKLGSGDGCTTANILKNTAIQFIFKFPFKYKLTLNG